MPRDFYATMAQVFPVLILALVWDSGYLAKLQGEVRRLRRDDTAAGVLFWTKQRVRVWTLGVSILTFAEVLIIALVLADFVPDSVPLRIFVMSGLATVLGTLMTRAAADIIRSTRITDNAAARDQAPDD